MSYLCNECRVKKQCQHDYRLDGVIPSRMAIKKICNTTLIKFAQRGSEVAVEEIIARHADRAGYWAAKYSIVGHDLSDLKQQCRLGVLQAIAAYDPAKGTSFSALASKAMQSQLNHAWAKSTTLMRNKGVEALSLDVSLRCSFGAEGGAQSDGEEQLAIDLVEGKEKSPESIALIHEQYENLINIINQCAVGHFDPTRLISGLRGGRSLVEICIDLNIEYSHLIKWMRDTREVAKILSVDNF